MTATPLRDGVRVLMVAARNEENTLARAVAPEDRDRAGAAGVAGIKELIARAAAGRRRATEMLREVAAGRSADGCEEPALGVIGCWSEVHGSVHAATSELLGALELVDEEQLAVNSGPPRNHPQYLWRDVAIYAVRSPMMNYADWHRRAGRDFEALAVLCRWYEASRASGLPAKVRSDASYDLACGLALAGRSDDAMELLPDAFAYNDRAAVPVLKAWAREDSDLAPLAGRADFRTLVGA
jgi:hypothetical protein